MVNKSGNIGTAGETAVKKVLRPFWPRVERRRLEGSLDRGDITGTPGLVWEVKAGKAAENASDAQVIAWLEETERERKNDNAAYGILVMKKKGAGHDNAGRWTAVMWSDAFAHLVGGLPSNVASGFPVRCTLDNIVAALTAAGWGDGVEVAP